MGDSNVAKWGDHQKKKFFGNNTEEAVIPFKEDHQGLLRLHEPLGASSKVGEEWSCLQSKAFFWKGKNNLWEGLSEPIKILFVLWKIFEEF